MARKHGESQKLTKEQSKQQKQLYIGEHFEYLEEKKRNENID